MSSTEGATVAAPDLTTAAWFKSSFSGNNGDCVEAAALDDGSIAVRNSNHPGDGVVFFTCTEMDAWIKGAQAGEFDSLR